MNSLKNKGFFFFFYKKISIYKFFLKRIFLVGCGALGCEYMRNFSSMNISENNEGEIIIMDDDTIEYSNLNRQYLYKF